MEKDIQRDKELTGWEDFKEPEISNEELALRLRESEEPKTVTVVEGFTKLLQDYIDDPKNNNDIQRIASPELLEEIVKFQNKPIDRFGTCPHCEASFDGGDIYEELLKKSMLAVNIGDARKAAALYGWTEIDKKRFSKLLTFELENGIFVQCPSCSHVFNQDTSKEYKSLYDVKQELLGQVVSM